MKRFRALIVLLGTVFILVGCGNSEVKKDDSKKSGVDLSGVTLNVGETGWGNWEDELKAAGLDNTPYKVNYSVFQGGNLCLDALTAGHLDFTGTSEIPPIFEAQSSNKDKFKIIAVQQSNTLTQELVIPKGSTIKSVADLKGKKVAYVSATTAHYFLIKMLQKAGLKWTDIQAEQLSVPDGLTALVGGKVDALASYGTAITSAHQNGATTLASAETILSGNFPYEASISAINDKAKHAAIVDYLERLNKSFAWARKNQKAWAQITADNTHQKLEDALSIIVKGDNSRITKFEPTSKSAIASEQDIANVFLDAGLLKNKTDVSTFWSDSFNNEIEKFSK